MPHARIFAEAPERARQVAKQLERRGYTVEIVAPGAAPETSADLEVTVTADSPLPFADEPVYAAPGSILGLSEYTLEEPEADLPSVVNEQPSSARASVSDALAQTRAAFRDGWQTIAAPLAQRLAAYRAARAERMAAERELRAQRQALEAVEQERRRAANERRRAERAENERLARIAAEQERERLLAEREEATRLARIAADDENARRQAESAEARRLAEIAEEKERARQRALQLEAQRAARLAAEQQETRRLAEYEQMLLRRRAEEKRRQDGARAADAARRRETELRLAALRAQEKHRAGVPTSTALVRERRWRMAFAAAACVSILAVMGLIASVQRHPASPVTNQTLVDSEALEQQAPFGAATALPAQAVLEKAAQPAPSAADAPQPRPKKRRVFRVDADSAMDEDGPEVIIRRKGRPPRSTERAGEVRRITDDDFEEEELE